MQVPGVPDEKPKHIGKTNEEFDELAQVFCWICRLSDIKSTKNDGCFPVFHDSQVIFGDLAKKQMEDRNSFGAFLK